MDAYDLILANGIVVTGEGMQRADVGICSIFRGLQVMLPRPTLAAWEPSPLY